MSLASRFMKGFTHVLADIACHCNVVVFQSLNREISCQIEICLIEYLIMRTLKYKMILDTSNRLAFNN